MVWSQQLHASGRDQFEVQLWVQAAEIVVIFVEMQCLVLGKLADGLVVSVGKVAALVIVERLDHDVVAAE